MSNLHRFAIAAAAGLAALLLTALIAGPAQGASTHPASTEAATDSAQYALEFGEPDPDPEHPDPEDQEVLEDPAGWPWWAWAALLLGLVAVGVPVALFLMRRVSRARSRTGEKGTDGRD